jgi:hypothetical protein
LVRREKRCITALRASAFWLAVAIKTVCRWTRP